MKREELKAMFVALRNDPHHHLGLGDIRITVAQQDLILDAITDSLPPAEGATDKFRDVLNEVQRYIETNGGATESEMKAIWNSLSCAITESEKRQPTADGAEEIIDDAETILHSHPYLKVWTETLFDSEMKVCSIEQALWAIEKAATLHAQKIADKIAMDNCEVFVKDWAGHDGDSDRTIIVKQGTLEEYISLVVHQLADKMVEERLREELMRYDQWLLANDMGQMFDDTMKCVDEYLKQRQL